MYEVAHTPYNQIEPDSTFSSISDIMGQSSSNSNRHSSYHQQQQPRQYMTGQSSKVYPRHSMSTADQHLKDKYKLRESTRVKNSNSSIANGSRTAGDRPVTISEMNAYNVEKSGAHNGAKLVIKEAPLKTITKNNREFYSVGEGYHKTEFCYYKTPDGGFHKLPPDSFHKMSEICYAKLSDGSFRRLDDVGKSTAKATGGATTGATETNQTVRNQVIRFLKRSKTHTPATIKEMQKSKDKERDRQNASAALERHNNSSNRKVVVTMMENGGLPIVATSKPPSKREHVREKSHKDHNRNSTKVSVLDGEGN